MLPWGGNMQRKEQGFTLIELMVTIAVFAIIAAIAAPSFGELIQKRRIENSIQDFEKTIMQARYDAVLLRKKVTINFSATGVISPTNLYWSVANSDDNLIFRNFTCNSSKWVGAEVAGIKKLEFSPKGSVELLKTTTDSNNNAITSNVILTAVEIELSNSKAKKFIEITPFGKISSAKESKEGTGCS